MGVKLGPVLSFRGLSENSWKVSALVVVESSDPAPAMIARPSDSTQEFAPIAKQLARYPASAPEFDAWRFDLSIPVNKEEQRVDYSINGRDQFSFWVPAKGRIPMSIYASCNGFSSVKLLNQTKDPQALWRELEAKHTDRPFHLLMMGGDQIYTDSMWENLPELHDWAALPFHERRTRKFTQTLARRLDRFYAGLYPARWSQPEIQTVLASIPTIMMWDDHDIFEGWGSHDRHLQDCDVFNGIFRTASRYFAIYQQQLAPGERHPMGISNQLGHTLGFNIGRLQILALDMRSERSAEQVISFATWKAIYDWLDDVPQSGNGGPEHLLVLTSIPVVYPDYSLIENAYGPFRENQELEVGLRDHWSSQPHREERVRFIHRMLDFSGNKRCRVTMLSSDVNVAALGVIRSNRPGVDRRAQLLNQLTSSGIVHPPPSGVVLFFLEHAMAKRTEDDPDISSEMTCFPGSRHYYIGARNWMSLESDSQNRIWAHWNIEGTKHPLTKVIHPIGFKMPSALDPLKDRP